MPSNIADAMQSVRDVFSDLYAQRYGHGAFLAFEALGVPVTPSMFRLKPDDPQLSPALGVERLSEIANSVIGFQDDAAHHTGRTVDTMAQLLIEQAAPKDASATESLGGVKRQMRKNFDVTLGSLSSLSPFHPVLASPVDWYDPEQTANWTQHTVEDRGHQAGSRVPRAVWRVLPDSLRPSLEKPIAAAYPYIQNLLKHADLPPAVGVVGGLLGGLLGGIQSAAPKGKATPDQQVVSQLTPLLTAFSAAQLDAKASQQEVTTPELHISFEHCIVGLNRPWFPQALTLLRNWYVPGYGQGAFSNSTGMDDPGLMPVLATGFVVIRHLSITAQWSEQDRAAVQASASIGPFSLVGRQFDARSGVLSCAGMQIIGWFCDPLPVLPPLQSGGAAH